MRTRLVSLALSMILSNTGLAFSVTYGELRSAGVKRCEAINGADYQSGLALNPDGYRSYYVRSECFQRIAVEFRDQPLCSQVKERWSLLSSSWGYSKGNCQKLVREGIASDRKILEDRKNRYLQSAVRLMDFRIEANGNGRDFNIVPAFTGEAGGGYWLRFELLLTAPLAQTVLVHSDGYHISGNSNLSLFVRQEDIRKRFPQFTLNHPYLVRASIVLAIGIGDQQGKWSDEFIDQVFPAKQRTQILEKEVRF